MKTFVLLLCLCLSEGHVPYKRDDRDRDSDKSPQKTRFVDLSHAFNNETASWPGRKMTFYKEFERYSSQGVWTASYGFCTSEHTSTHIDAPYHFNPDGRRLHEIPFEDLINVPGVMIDVSDKVTVYKDGQLVVNKNYGLTREDVIEWEQKNGKIPQGAVVLLRTGWESRWGNPKAFRGEELDANGNALATPPSTFTPAEDTGIDKRFYDPADAWISETLGFPAFAECSAKYLAVERAVRGVGTDTISIDPGNQNVMSPAHRTFASRNIWMLEMVANLHNLPPSGFNLWVVPFKIDRGTGAPTRVVARLNA